MLRHTGDAVFLIPIDKGDTHFGNKVRVFTKGLFYTSPAKFTACYSAYDGVAITGSPYYMTDILRGELGFKGYVYSDWGLYFLIPLLIPEAK